jgi:hypothetical protein
MRGSCVTQITDSVGCFCYNRGMAGVSHFTFLGRRWAAFRRNSDEPWEISPAPTDTPIPAPTQEEQLRAEEYFESLLVPRWPTKEGVKKYD